MAATVGIAALVSAAVGAAPAVWASFSPSPAGAAATSVTVDQVFTAVGTKSATAGVTKSGGQELALAFVVGDQQYGNTPGQTATVRGGGSDWVLVARANTQMGNAEVWSQEGNGSTTFSVTAALPEDKKVALTVVTFRGSTATGASATAGYNGGAPAVSLNPTAVGSLVYGAGFDWDFATRRSLPDGQVMDSQTLDDLAGTFWVQHASAPTTGGRVTINDTSPTNHKWNLVAVEVVPRSSAPAQGYSAPPSPASGPPTPAWGAPTPASTPPTPASTPPTTVSTPPTTVSTPPTTSVPSITPDIGGGGGNRPGPTNTGVPGGHNLLVLNGGVGAMTLPAANTSPAGCARWDGSNMFTNSDGCTIHDVDANGTFEFSNNNTTLQFDKIHDPNRNFPAVDNNSIIRASWRQKVSGALIEDTEVYSESGISYGIAGSNFTLVRDNIYNASHDLQITGAGNVNVTASYLHGVVAQPGDHTELAYLDSSPNVTFRGNTWVFNPSPGSAVAEVFSDGINGPGGPMVLDGNWWGGTGAQWIVHVDVPGSGLSFTNNHVAPTYGLALAFFGGDPAAKGGNTWDGSGTTPDHGDVVNGQPIPGL